MSFELREIETQEAWTGTLGQLGKDHLLQSWRWGAFKSKYGWKPVRLAWFNDEDVPIAAAQMLYRTQLPGLTMGYCPKGPLLDWEQTEVVQRVLEDLSITARSRGAFYLKMDPLLPQPASRDSILISPNPFTPLRRPFHARPRRVAEIRRAGAVQEHAPDRPASG